MPALVTREGRGRPRRVLVPRSESLATANVNAHQRSSNGNMVAQNSWLRARLQLALGQNECCATPLSPEAHHRRSRRPPQLVLFPAWLPPTFLRLALQPLPPPTHEQTEFPRQKRAQHPQPAHVNIRQTERNDWMCKTRLCSPRRCVASHSTHVASVFRCDCSCGHSVSSAPSGGSAPVPEDGGQGGQQVHKRRQRHETTQAQPQTCGQAAAAGGWAGLAVARQ